jgi:hypothetical protein
MYRELLAQQAEPYLVHAKLAYDACAANARNVKSLSHWSSFCGGRSEHLRGTQPLGQGTTTVSVTHE